MSDMNGLNQDPTNVIYNQLKERLAYQKEVDKVNILQDHDTDELEEIFGYWEADYEMYYSKLELITKIKELDNDKKQRYFQTLGMIDRLNDLSEKQKLELKLSYGVLVNYFWRIQERTDEEIFMLSACSSRLDLKDYNYYISVLSEKEVAEAIVNKTENFMTQVDIAYAVICSQNESPYEVINRANHSILVNSAISVVNNYNIEYENAEKRKK